MMGLIRTIRKNMENRVSWGQASKMPSFPFNLGFRSERGQTPFHPRGRGKLIPHPATSRVGDFLFAGVCGVCGTPLTFKQTTFVFPHKPSLSDAEHNEALDSISNIVYSLGYEQQRIQALAGPAGRDFSTRKGLTPEGVPEWETSCSADAQ